MKTIDTLTFEQFANKYCERQVCTPLELRHKLQSQKEKFKPNCFILLECHMMDSSLLGSFTLLPVGPNNTFKTVPEHPVSPRGLASDMSVVVAILPASEIN